MNDEAKKAFDAWCASDSPRYHPADDGMLNRRDWKVWQAAILAERDRIGSMLRAAGASIPAPDLKGTIESAMTTALSIALAFVEAGGET